MRRESGCDHQLPLMGSPATASTRLGTGPRADMRTTPCLRTKARACVGVISASREMTVSTESLQDPGVKPRRPNRPGFREMGGRARRDAIGSSAFPDSVILLKGSRVAQFLNHLSRPPRHISVWHGHCQCKAIVNHVADPVVPEPRSPRRSRRASSRRAGMYVARGPEGGVSTRPVSHGSSRCSPGGGARSPPPRSAQSKGEAHEVVATLEELVPRCSTRSDPVVHRQPIAPHRDVDACDSPDVVRAFRRRLHEKVRRPPHPREARHRSSGTTANLNVYPGLRRPESSVQEGRWGATTCPPMGSAATLRRTLGRGSLGFRTTPWLRAKARARLRVTEATG